MKTLKEGDSVKDRERERDPHWIKSNYSQQEAAELIQPIRRRVGGRLERMRTTEIVENGRGKIRKRSRIKYKAIFTWIMCSLYFMFSCGMKVFIPVHLILSPLATACSQLQTQGLPRDYHFVKCSKNLITSSVMVIKQGCSKWNTSVLLVAYYTVYTVHYFVQNVCETVHCAMTIVVLFNDMSYDSTKYWMFNRVL